jgi:photosystem II stability/assembly factor-like uncharacterized protein
MLFELAKHSAIFPLLLGQQIMMANITSSFALLKLHNLTLEMIILKETLCKPCPCRCVHYVSGQYTTEEVELVNLPNPRLDSITMFDALNGWGMVEYRSVLVHTKDGGSTWQDVTPLDVALPEGFTTIYLAPFFLDAQTAWFTTPGMESSLLLHTEDGGANWEQIFLPFGSGELYFLDPLNGYLLSSLGAGAGSHYLAIYATHDAGHTWTLRFTHEPGMSKSLPESGAKSGIVFRDLDNAWMGGNIPMEDFMYLYRSIDGGKNWNQVELILPPKASRTFLETYTPVFVDPGNAFLPVRVLASGEDFRLAFYKSVDGGESWQYTSEVFNGRIYEFIDSSYGWASDGWYLYHTVDGSITWVDASGALPPGEYLLQVEFVNPDQGWVLTTSDPETIEITHLYMTQDGGGNWSKIN